MWRRIAAISSSLGSRFNRPVNKPAGLCGDTKFELRVGQCASIRRNLLGASHPNGIFGEANTDNFHLIYCEIWRPGQDSNL
jgi:hypothetical protein